MTESDSKNNTQSQSKADKRIIQVKLASEAATKKNNSNNDSKGS